MPDRAYPSPVLHPPRAGLPILLSIPHSGREYGPELLANAAQGRSSLEILEDPLVDRLAWRAIGSGIAAIVQPVPRAAIDCNRDEEEVDPAAIEGISPAPVGQRARHGLGLVPSRTHRHGRLWRRPIDRAELQRRIEQVHRPYHRSIKAQLNGFVATFGEAILIDCHSMPTRPGQPDFVIGDRHGSSCDGWLASALAGLVRSAGYRAAMNEPYAGGAIVARHGRPEAGIHAIQLEIDRRLYLAPDGRTGAQGFDRVASFIEHLAHSLGEQILHRSAPAAAE